ncbi:MAG: hypothetical protein EB127_29345, partial [Alphaproteobacteria bacterium]|nr:hypothetical protein [Alphaproteobacteria bacterium]
MDAKIYNPWNPHNRDIPTAEITRIAGYTPKRLELFRQACVHKSFVKAKQDSAQIVAPRPADCMDLKDADNEHIEFVGDGFLDAIVGDYLEHRYPGEGEGFWTSLRSDLVNNEHLGSLAIKLGMAPWLIMSRHMEDICNGRQNNRMLGSMLEAWVAAMYRDRASDDPKTAFWYVQQWVINILETYVDFGGLIAIPEVFTGKADFITSFLSPVLGQAQSIINASGIHATHLSHSMEYGLMGASVLIVFVGA